MHRIVQITNLFQNILTLNKICISVRSTDVMHSGNLHIWAGSTLEEAKRMCIQSPFTVAFLLPIWQSHWPCQYITCVVHRFCWGKGKQALASMLSSSQLQSSFINSLDSGVSSKHVKGSRQLFWGPCYIVLHSPPIVGSQENGLLQDNVVTWLRQSQGADRECEDGGRGLPHAVSLRNNCNTVHRPAIVSSYHLA